MKLFHVIVKRTWYEGGSHLLATCATRELAELVVAHYTAQAEAFAKAMRSWDEEPHSTDYPEARCDWFWGAYYSDLEISIEECDLLEAFDPDSLP